LSDVREGVVLLHGHGRTSLSMRPLKRVFARSGYETYCKTYASRSVTLEAIADGVMPPIVDFGKRLAKVHFVTHSLGGLVARVLADRKCPANLARVVMLAPPNAGSEWVDLLGRFRLDRIVLGPVTQSLATGSALGLRPVNYELGIIAGNRALDPIFPRLLVARPNDGKVSVASTMLEGMADHIVLPVSHTLMPGNREAMRQALTFVRSGAFARD